MLSRLRRLPSPALVISAIALIVAVGGGTFAIAASDTKQDKKIAKKISNKVVTKRAPNLSVNHANSADNATHANSADSAPPTGSAGGDLTGNYPNPLIDANSVTTGKLASGAVHADNLGTITQVTNVLTGVPNGGVGSVTATCPAGTRIISGGGQPTFFGVEMTSTLRSGNGWLYQARNTSGVTTSLTAFAYCLAA